MITIDQHRFFANLQLTQAYCAQQLRQPPKPEWQVLRSIVGPVRAAGKWFATIPDGSGGGSRPVLWEEWTRKSDPFYGDAFVELFDWQLAYKARESAALTHDSDCPGKILVVEYGMNIPDGAVEVETEGFFDEWDLPPIDTWFYNDYNPGRGGILFAWIPEQFTDLADKAIAVHFLDIMHWFIMPNKWLK